MVLRDVCLFGPLQHLLWIGMLLRLWLVVVFGVLIRWVGNVTAADFPRTSRFPQMFWRLEGPHIGAHSIEI